MLTEPLKSHAGIKDEIAVRRPRSQVSDLGARALPRGTRGGHREGPRAQEAAGLPESGGRSARSTGMMTGSDSSPAVAGGLARHIPVLGRSVVEFLAPRDDGIYIDATFGAGGYSRAILAAANCHVIGIDRDQQRDRARRRPGKRGRLAGSSLVEDRFSNLASRGARPAATTRSTASSSISACRRCSSTRPSAASRSVSTDRSTCGWAASGPSAADVVAAASERDLAADHRDAGRGAPCPRSRPCHRPRARRERRSTPRVRSPTSSRASCTRGLAPFIRRPARSRRCASSSTRSLPSLRPH